MSATLDFALTAAPETAPSPGEAKVVGSISKPVTRALSNVGVYVQHYLRHLDSKDSAKFRDHTNVYAEHTASEAANGMNGQDQDDSDDEEESEEMLTMDPKDWKEQDHYAVLGLSKLRYLATVDDIIKNHRKKVLRHHPDKKAASGNADDDGFFKCIQKAFDILMDTTKRRQWDSVDPGIPDDIPSAKAKGEFFELYGPVFARESRFSNATPVPQLGDMDSSREDVEAFYEFWYAFDSWRSFEYLDKEDVDGGGNRDDKRWIESKNKKERANRKNADNQRIRSLVDQALKKDPRMAKFKEEDKKKRNAKRNAREEEAKRAAEEKKKAEEAAKQEAVKAAAAEDEQKKLRQQAHKAFKKEQRALKVLFKNLNYFAPAGESPSAAQIADAQAKLDKILAAKHELDGVVAVRTELEAAHAAGNGSAVLDDIVSKL